MFFDDNGAIIISSGHLHTYFGYSGDELPTYQTPSFFASSSDSSTRHYFENLTSTMEQGSTLFPLITDNVINNSDIYIDFASSLLKKFNTTADNHPILLVDKQSTSTDAKRKELASILFEREKVPCLFFINEAVAGLFSTGSTGGVYFDSGEKGTTVSAVHDGFLLKKRGLIRH